MTNKPLSALTDEERNLALRLENGRHALYRASQREEFIHSIVFELIYKPDTVIRFSDEELAKDVEKCLKKTIAALTAVRSSPSDL